MSPETHAKLSHSDFESLKTSIRLISETERKRREDIAYAAPLPEEIGIQITNRCNLRCKHCFQYNETGSFHSKKKRDLSIDCVKEVLKKTRDIHSRLYIWGGEPLIHSKWKTIASLISREQRWTVICTNGLLLKKGMSHLYTLGQRLTLLVSLDGFQDAHDTLRGKGVYDRVYQNVRSLLIKKKKQEFKGKLSILCVVNEHNIDRLFEFARFCESMDIDALYINFPWYISKDTQKKMDDIYHHDFKWLQPSAPPYSWHSHNYRIRSRYKERLKKQVGKIITRKWHIRVHLQPPIDRHQVHDLFTDKIKSPYRHCIAISNRLEIDAFGNCGACKFFPEFRMGNLSSETLETIWHNKPFKTFRKALNMKLMPICKSCSLLYLNRS